MLIKIKKFFGKVGAFLASCFGFKKAPQHFDQNKIKKNVPVSYQSLFEKFPQEIKSKIFDDLASKDIFSLRQVCSGSRHDTDVYLKAKLPVDELASLGVIPSKEITAKGIFYFLAAQRIVKRTQDYSERIELAKVAIEENNLIMIYLLLKNKFTDSIVTQVYVEQETSYSLFRKSKWSWNPLIYYAALVGQPEIVFVLLKMGADINEKIPLEHDYQSYKIMPVVNNYSKVNYGTLFDKPVLIPEGKPKTHYTYSTIEDNMDNVKNPSCRSLLYLAYVEMALKQHELQKATEYFRQSLLGDSNIVCAYLENIEQTKCGFQRRYTEGEINLLSEIKVSSDSYCFSLSPK